MNYSAARLRTFPSREEAALRHLQGLGELSQAEATTATMDVLQRDLTDHFWFLDIFLFSPFHGDGKSILLAFVPSSSLRLILTKVPLLSQPHDTPR